MIYQMKYGRELSQFGTLTPKPFKPMLQPEAGETLPTGVWQYKRIELRHLLPQLGSIPLSVYYRLRIACCAYMQVDGPDKLHVCERCNFNCGFVCPRCLGAHWLYDGSPFGGTVACEGCTYPHIDGKNVRHMPDADRELITVQRWLAKAFPYGVPHHPTAEELAVMDDEWRYAGGQP